MEIEGQIRRYVLESFLFTTDDTRLDSRASFLEEGVIDSTGVLELVAFVEETFGIEVNDEEILPENFDSVVKLAAFVKAKMDGRSA